jgi:hypothetical protein
MVALGRDPFSRPRKGWQCRHELTRQQPRQYRLDSAQRPDGSGIAIGAGGTGACVLAVGVLCEVGLPAVAAEAGITAAGIGIGLGRRPPRPEHLRRGIVKLERSREP